MHIPAFKAKVSIDDLKRRIRIVKVFWNINDVQDGVLNGSNTLKKRLVVIMKPHRSGIRVAGIVDINTWRVGNVEVSQIFQLVIMLKC